MRLGLASNPPFSKERGHGVSTLILTNDQPQRHWRRRTLHLRIVPQVKPVKLFPKKFGGNKGQIRSPFGSHWPGKSASAHVRRHVHEYTGGGVIDTLHTETTKRRKKRTAAVDDALRPPPPPRSFVHGSPLEPSRALKPQSPPQLPWMTST